MEKSYAEMGGRVDHMAGRSLLPVLLLLWEQNLAHSKQGTAQCPPASAAPVTFTCFHHVYSRPSEG